MISFIRYSSLSSHHQGRENANKKRIEFRTRSKCCQKSSLELIIENFLECYVTFQSNRCSLYSSKCTVAILALIPKYISLVKSVNIWPQIAVKYANLYLLLVCTACRTLVIPPDRLLLLLCNTEQPMRRDVPLHFGHVGRTRNDCCL